MKKVWINGCFDILHRGHIELFKFAKSKGDYLIVGIDSDNRVKQLKGPSRPINAEEDRKFMLDAIGYIDKVIIFKTAGELRGIIHHLKPDVMIVGSDYREKVVIGAEYAKELVFFDRIGDYSTTNILEKK